MSTDIYSDVSCDICRYSDFQVHERKPDDGSVIRLTNCSVPAELLVVRGRWGVVCVRCTYSYTACVRGVCVGFLSCIYM